VFAPKIQSKNLTHFPVSTSQKIIISLPAKISIFPFKPNVTEENSSFVPFPKEKVFINRPVSASQRFTSLSHLPVAINLPSGLNATEETASGILIISLFFKFQITVLSPCVEYVFLSSLRSSDGLKMGKLQ